MPGLRCDSRHPHHRDKCEHHGRAGLRGAGVTNLHVSAKLLMPCHEYCGLGHSEMWANVQVLSLADAKPERGRAKVQEVCSPCHASGAYPLHRNFQTSPANPALQSTSSSTTITLAAAPINS